MRSIISLYGAFNEILIALDAQDLITARTNSDSELPELAQLPSVGTHMRPDAERIIAAKPELVILLKGRQDSLASLRALEDLDIPIVQIEINDFPQLFEATRQLGQLVGKEEKAEELVRTWQERLEKLRKNNTGETRPRVFFEARYPNLLAAGSKGIVNAIIEAAGGENVVKAPRRLARINEEWLLDARPDIYLMQKGPMNPMPTPLEERANYSALSPSLSRFIVDEKMFSRPGPNSIKAAEFLAQILHDANKNQNNNIKKQ